MKLQLSTKLILRSLLVIALLYSLGANAQVLNLDMGSGGSTSYRLFWDWNGFPTDNYLIIYKQGGPETMLPVDGQTYTTGQTFGDGKVLIVIPGVASDGITPIEGFFFNRSTLSEDGTDYWFTIYPYSSSGPTYTTSNPAEVAFVTPGIVEEPMMQPSNATHSVGATNGSSRTITFSYDRSPYELDIPYESRYLVVYKVGSPITYVPTDGSPDVTFGTANLSDGSKGRLDQGTDNETVSIDVTTSEQTVYFKIFSLNKADFNHSIETSPSYNYLTTNPLEFTATIPAETNTAPTVSDATFSVDENSTNGTLVGTVSATDPQNDPLTFSITAGNTNNAFSIDASSGEIEVSNSSALDFETNPTFTLTVEVSDGSLSDNATITVNVNDVTENLAPSMNNQTFTVNENASIATSVGTLVATDPENDPLTYSILTGNTNSSFLLIASTGEILVNAALDFSTTPTYSLEIEVSDGSLSDLAMITINVNDPGSNSAPVVMDQSFSIEENTANNELVGTVIATDADNDPLTYSIISGNTNNAFSLGSSTGEIEVATSGALDFETTPTFSLLVSVTDGELSDVATITIDLLDMAENAAPVIAAQTFSLDENSANGTSIGTVEASDVENDPLTFNIESGNDANAFLIVGSTGELLVINSAELDFESNPSFTLGIGVSDGTSTSIGDVTINLNDVEETVLGFDFEEKPFVVYPNPARSFISVDETISVRQISLWDMGGKLITNFASNTFNQYSISHLKAGIYNIIIRSQDEVIRSKLIIE